MSDNAPRKSGLTAKRAAAFCLAFIACASLAVLAAHFALAAAKGFGLELSGEALPSSVKGSNALLTIIGNVVKTALGFVGTIFFVLMLYAGFLWMTARGNEKTAERAKEIIIAAVIGVIIVALAYVITNTIISGIGGQGQSGAPANQPTNATNAGGLPEECKNISQQFCYTDGDCYCGGTCANADFAKQVPGTCTGRENAPGGGGGGAACQGGSSCQSDAQCNGGKCNSGVCDCSGAYGAGGGGSPYQLLPQ